MEARHTKRGKVLRMIFGSSKKNSWRGPGVNSKDIVSAGTLFGGADWQAAGKQEEEFNDDGIKVVLSYIDHEGVRRCVISGMFAGLLAEYVVDRTQLALKGWNFKVA